MFTKDRSDAPKMLESKYFKDESSSLRGQKSGKSERLDSAMFRDESRAPASKRAKSEKVKNEKKKKVEKIVEEEEYTEEPDFSDFVSKYEIPEEVKKVEKKVEKSARPEVYKSEVVKSKYESVKVEPSAKYESKKVESKIKSVANFKTAFTDDRDIEMAAKQTQIAELTGQELEEQEKWAFEKLKAHAGTCPAGFAWGRWTIEECGEQVRLDGYRCRGGSHFVSHEMVAEGKGGVMMRTDAFIDWDAAYRRAGMQEPSPFIGVRWEVVKDEELSQMGYNTFSSLGARLSGGAQQPRRSPFGNFGGGAGSGGFGNSSFDPVGRFSLPQATSHFLIQQHGQPGRQRLSVLNPNYNSNQADDEDDQQQEQAGYGDPWSNGGQGGLFGRGYNGQGGVGMGGNGGRRR
ncbi:MAG: hypothetical protein CL912_12195 [Deltaproteobacteria bacterium]|nr:hypothetical protein [Deltaproteobacteria bacterium]|tara:strand:+ start:1605 stop:2813 length:1209 start_codon:yes stop_codon:yes gene_type:complete